MLGRVGAVAVIGMLICSAALPAGARSDDSIRLSSLADSEHHELLYPLAGSTSTLVYSATPRLTAHTAGLDTRIRVTTIVATNRSGSRHRTLGLFRERDADWSLAGHTLTAVGNSSDDEVVQTNRVDWWNTRTGSSGHMSLGGSHYEPTYQYLSAAPGGMTYVDTGRHVLHMASTAGATTSFGSPFGIDGTVAGVAPGPHGLVVFGADAAAAPMLAFMPYDDPGSYQPLQSGATDSVSCTAVSARYASCETGPTRGLGTSVALVPLNGGAPTASTVCPTNPGLVGDSIVWANVCSGYPGPIERLVAGSASPSASKALTFGVELSALGDAVVTPPDGGYRFPRIEAVDRSGPTTLVPPQASPATVGAFALAPGRVLFSQDAPGNQVVSRRLTRRDHRLHAAPPEVLARSNRFNNRRLQPLVMAASNNVAVYAVQSKQGQSNVRRLEVVRHGHVMAVPHSESKGIGGDPVGNESVQLSGGRLLIERVRYRDVFVSRFDLRTHRTTRVERLAAGSLNRAALSGNRLAYVDGRGVVRSEDLATGRKVVLGHVKGAPEQTRVFAHGDWVGWVAQGPLGAQSFLRNVEPKHSTVRLDRQIWQLTGRGAVLIARNAQPQQMQLLHTAVTLSGYHGRNRALLPRQPFVAGPQLVGGVLAWAGADGVLRARLLR